MAPDHTKAATEAAEAPKLKLLRTVELVLIETLQVMGSHDMLKKLTVNE